MFLDVQLGPASFTLRRAAALTVRVVVGAVRIRGLPQWLVAPPPSRHWHSPPTSSSAPLASRCARHRARRHHSRGRLAAGCSADRQRPCCRLSQLRALRFAIDLVPQSGRCGAAVGRLANLYVDGAGRVDAELSFTALGGPAVSLAALYLLWGWRRAGGPHGSPPPLRSRSAGSRVCPS